MTTRASALIRAQDEAWAELRSALGSFPVDHLTEAGYNDRGWSVKDLIAHIASWQAEAGRALIQIRQGTFEDHDRDVEAMNAEFHESWRNVDLRAVNAHLHASHARMLEAFGRILEDPPGPAATAWFVESSTEHYRGHLTRLLAWRKEMEGAS